MWFGTFVYAVAFAGLVGWISEITGIRQIKILIYMFLIWLYKIHLQL